jgi:hypothetical protein
MTLAISLYFSRQAPISLYLTYARNSWMVVAPLILSAGELIYKLSMHRWSSDEEFPPLILDRLLSLPNLTRLVGSIKLNYRLDDLFFHEHPLLEEIYGFWVSLDALRSRPSRYGSNLKLHLSVYFCPLHPYAH